MTTARVPCPPCAPWMNYPPYITLHYEYLVDFSVNFDQSEVYIYLEDEEVAITLNSNMHTNILY